MQKPLGSLVLDTVASEGMDDQVVFLGTLLASRYELSENLHVELLSLGLGRIVKHMDIRF